MNKVIRLLPNFVQFATLFFVMALYFRWDVSGFFESAEITIPAVLSLAFTLLTNGRSMHKDAISVLESENRHVQKEVERLQREVARLTKAAQQLSVEKAEEKIRTLVAESETARVNGNWRQNAFENLLRDLDKKCHAQIEREIKHILTNYP